MYSPGLWLVRKDKMILGATNSPIDDSAVSWNGRFKLGELAPLRDLASWRDAVRAAGWLR